MDDEGVGSSGQRPHPSGQACWTSTLLQFHFHFLCDTNQEQVLFFFVLFHIVSVITPSASSHGGPPNGDGMKDGVAVGS